MSLSHRVLRACGQGWSWAEPDAPLGLGGREVEAVQDTEALLNRVPRRRRVARAGLEPGPQPATKRGGRRVVAGQAEACRSPPARGVILRSPPLGGRETACLGTGSRSLRRFGQVPVEGGGLLVITPHRVVEENGPCRPGTR